MYEVILRRKAQRYFEKVDSILARRLGEAFTEFEQEGCPQGAVPLRGELAGAWRVRVGDFRIVFEVIEDEKRVIILQIGPRGDIYKR